MRIAWILIPAACALGAGCSVAVEPLGTPPPVRTDIGSLTVRWLVTGSSEGNACGRYGLADAEVVVYDAAGRPVARDTAACTQFSLTIPLAEATYSADVRMLDDRGRAATETKTLHAIEIIAGTDLAINLDFPTDSLR